MRITSTRNPVVQEVRSLARASVRRSRRQYLAEGIRLVSEALATDRQAALVLYDADALSRTAAGDSLLSAVPAWAERAYAVSPHVLAAAAQTEAPAGIVAVLRTPEPPSLAGHAGDLLGLVLDGLADPGNAGTILRTADAFAAGYAITTPGSVDLYAPKVVRAGMGAHFRLPLYEHMGWEEIAAALAGVAFVVADSAEGEPVQDLHWPHPACLVIGSEAAGPSAPALAHAQARVRIPIRPEVESLNAAAAAAILLYAGVGSGLTGRAERYR